MIDTDEYSEPEDVVGPLLGWGCVALTVIVAGRILVQAILGI